MIVLHLGAYQEQFLLWGEVSNAPDPKSKLDLPYRASSKELVKATTFADLRLDEKKSTHHQVWLPTQGKTPLPSSPLIADFPIDKSDLVLHPWRVQTMHLPPEDALDLLVNSMGKEMLAPGVLIGSDIRFFTHVLRLCGALIAQEQFVPGLSENDGSFQAIWEPVISGENHEILSSLAKAMPDACRAVSDRKDQPPDEAPLSIITQILKFFVDYLIRMSWTDKPRSKSRKATKKSFSSIHDQWVYALRDWNSSMSGDFGDLENFSEQVKIWRRALSMSTHASFRLCFRLEEPEEDDQQWYVRYLLNAIDDPSLFIEVADAWEPKKQTQSIFSKYRINIHEFLLTSLGHVSSLHEVLAESLKASRPGGVELDTQGAYTFLNEIAWLLQQSGYSVQLPSWWTSAGHRRQFSVRASVKSPQMQSRGMISLGDVVEFDWQLALGDEQISLQEIETLTRLKMPLVKIRGQWMQFDAPKIQEAINFWKKMSTGDITGRDIVHMSLGTAQTPSKLPFGGVEATGWIGDLLHSLEHGADIEEIPVSNEFDGTLRPYQSRGYSWLAFLQQWGFGACLADDMGLGKTPQTLALIQQTLESNPQKPILVVSPTSVIGNWQKEAAHFTPNLQVLVHHGARRIKDIDQFKQEVSQKPVVITGFPLLHRDFQVLSEIKWGVIILDEAQNIKNPGTKQAKAAQSLRSDYRIALTGTPVENNVGELWSIMEFLNPGFLHTQAEFKRRFFVPIQIHNNLDAIQRLKRITGPFILRRLKTDKTIIDDLPDKQETNVFTKLTKEQGSLYRAVVKEIDEALKGAKDVQRKGLILATLTKLKQICNHPAQFLHDASEISGRSGKLIRLIEMLEEVYEAQDRALIFTQFTEMGTMLKQHLQETFGREALFLHGGVPKKQRDRMIEHFQQDDSGAQFFILSLKAAGTGLNLTRANHVFHYDRWWNPAVENQATDRAFRIGQTKHVQVYKFVCTGTIEEHINDMIQQKQEVADSVVSTGEQWVTEMSTRELKKILRLQKDAIAS